MNTENKLKFVLCDPDIVFNTFLFLNKTRSDQIKEIIVSYRSGRKRQGDHLIELMTSSAGYKLVNSKDAEEEYTSKVTGQTYNVMTHVRILQKNWLSLKEKLEQLGIKP